MRITPCILFLFITLHPTLHAQNLIGHWKGESEGEIGSMTFDKEGYVTFIVDDETLGGKNFISEGLALSMHYEYNTEVEPHTIDFIMKSADGSMEYSRMIGIYKFENPKTLIVNMDFLGQSRPLEFDHDDVNQITLRKQKG